MASFGTLVMELRFMLVIIRGDISRDLRIANLGFTAKCFQHVWVTTNYLVTKLE